MTMECPGATRAEPSLLGPFPPQHDLRARDGAQAIAQNTGPRLVSVAKRMQTEEERCPRTAWAAPRAEVPVGWIGYQGQEALRAASQTDVAGKLDPSMTLTCEQTTHNPMTQKYGNNQVQSPPSRRRTGQST